MEFRRRLVIGVILLVIATAAVSAMGLLALRGTTARDTKLSHDFVADLVAAEKLRAFGEEVASARRVVLARSTLEPWLERSTKRAHQVIADIRTRTTDLVGASHVNDIEFAVEDCKLACLKTEERSRGAHDRLEATLARFLDRKTTMFEAAVSRTGEASSRSQVALVVLTFLILASGSTLATVALRRIDHLFAREQEAAEAAKRESASRQEVLAIVAHDLRTPLSTIVLGSALLAETLPDDGGRHGPRRQLHTIRNAAERMTGLIDEILDTSRIEAGTIKLHLGPCDVGEILDKAIELVQLRAAAKALIIRGEPPATRIEVRADPERLLQILSNLMTNAVKFTTAGEIIASAEPQDGHVLFTVGDTGPGIPPDQREHLFDRYWQATGSEQRGSLGLGLFICKSLVEAHGGKLWVEGREGGGSQFRFTIPAENDRARAIDPVRAG